MLMDKQIVDCIVLEVVLNSWQFFWGSEVSRGKNVEVLDYCEMISIFFIQKFVTTSTETIAL